MGTQNLRVALFSGNYNCVKDGAAVAMNRLVAFLERQGVDTVVFAPTIERPAFAPAGTLVSVPSVPLPYRSEYRLALGLPRACRERLAAFRPMLFHLSAPDLLGYSALRLARRWNIPAVASFHTRFDTYARYYGLGWMEKFLTAYLRHFYGRCQQVYAPSQSMADVLRAEGIAREPRIWGRGADGKLFHPGQRSLAWRRSLGIGDDEVAIAFAGRLVREKGLKIFADVLGRLQALGVRHRALVIGDGPERAAMAAMLPHAIFAGFLGGEALARAYASADIFFFPSVTETFGIVTLEAMACGVPVVCARATGSSSLVTHGMTGFLAEPDDEAGYARHLAALAGDAAMRQRMGAACVEQARPHDWDSAMQGLLAHYRELLQARGSVSEPAIAADLLPSGVPASLTQSR
ncbi:MAG TPA: glycosyltransferase family 1 protein [Dongiaceae bacterium]|jgi:glycosyltransferase involved in cell wall biosynthesis